MLAVLLCTMAIVPDAKARPRSASAAGLTCRDIVRGGGFASREGREAVQWIVGYLSGVLAERLPRGRIGLAGPEGVAAWTRVACNGRPGLQVVEIAEAIVRERW